jgi:phage gp36-like protein
MGSLYCAPSDLATYAVPPAALTPIPIATQQAQCAAASEKADSYMRGRFQLPLLAWGVDLTMQTAFIAAYFCLSQRGFNPASGADQLVVKNYNDAIEWFKGIERQSVHPDVTPSGSPGTNYQLPQVSSGQARGWQQTDSSGRPTVS